MLRVLRSFAATTMLLVALFCASTALAAPAPWQRVDVILHAEESGGVMLVSGELPPGTKLPAEAELSVPAGSTLLWTGEILGGATSEDPSLTCTTGVGEWGEVFSGDTVIATAILDRLLHHSTTIPIKGESYRLKDRKKAGIVTTSAG